MGQPRVFPLADRALGGTLERRLRKQREAGTAYKAIANDLQEDGIDVSGETVRKWCLELGIEKAA